MDREKQIEDITELLIEFDEMGFAPTTTVPDPDDYAIDWRNRLTNALQGYRKQSEFAREIFEEIEKLFFDEYLLGNITAGLFEDRYAELKKKYTEEQK